MKLALTKKKDRSVLTLSGPDGEIERVEIKDPDCGEELLSLLNHVYNIGFRTFPMEFEEER